MAISLGIYPIFRQTHISGTYCKVLILGFHSRICWNMSKYMLFNFSGEMMVPRYTYIIWLKSINLLFLLIAHVRVLVQSACGTVCSHPCPAARNKNKPGQMQAKNVVGGRVDAATAATAKCGAESSGNCGVWVLQMWWEPCLHCFLSVMFTDILIVWSQLALNKIWMFLRFTGSVATRARSRRISEYQNIRISLISSMYNWLALFTHILVSLWLIT